MEEIGGICFRKKSTLRSGAREAVWGSVAAKYVWTV